MRHAFPLFVFLATALGGVACSGGSTTTKVTPPAPDAGSTTTLVFDTTADLHSPDHFFDMPYPSDARLTASGAPDVAGLANPDKSTVFEGLRTIAMDRAGFPVTPVAYFQFTDALPNLVSTEMIAANSASPILLIDVDPASATRGALTPTVAESVVSDVYVPNGVLAVAARPGFILEPHHQYAFVVRAELRDGNGKPLGVSPTFAGVDSTSLAPLYAPLWATLPMINVDRADVVAATVFTTGDVVADTYALSTKVLGAYSVDVQAVKLDADGDTKSGYCELHGEVTYPQFQQGVPPFDTGGSFAYGADGLPIQTRLEIAPITLTIPTSPMPSGGYPIVVYFHGTGGVSDAIADRGTWHYATNAAFCPGGELDTWNGQTGCNTAGTGPGYIVAPHGIAMIASALPMNPQRFPAGANQAFPEYFNINNVASLRDIFRQGIIEQRLFMDAVRRLTIPPAALAACTGVSLPAGETAYHFRDDPLLAQGQSMGAMYANLISAVEPRVKAVVATGAGGYWSWFILQSDFVEDVKGKVGLLLDLRGDFSFMHPAMSMIQTGLEPADPIVYMPRVAHEPLPNHPSRPIYQPVGLGDSYFPTPVQDAVALAYRNEEAGSTVWPTMQSGLSLVGLQGLATYPLTQNLTSVDGTKYTGATVQYLGDGIYDPHAIYTQLDAVKYQYACFFDTFVATGNATIPAPSWPQPLSAPCPR